jgi:hypothetical protein
MRRVENETEFHKIVLEARTCVHIDSRRVSTSLHLLVFDDGMLCADYFLAALRSLMGWSGDPSAYYVVLDPHPVDSFYRPYKKYPVLEIARGDAADAYLGALNEDVGDGRGFSLSDLSLTWVIVPPSNKWFIHAIRSDQDDSGHLWVPSEWVDKLLAAHPGVFRDALASLQEGDADTPGQTSSAVP